VAEEDYKPIQTPNPRVAIKRKPKGSTYPSTLKP
jgi:hypothetical protein